MDTNLKAALTKIANQDLSIARREGVVVVVGTKRGNLEVRSSGTVYSITLFNSADVLYSGKAAGARAFLLASYDVVAG